MSKGFLKTAFGWGAALWLIGYILGFVFFFFVPKALLGWAIMPFGIIITLWVLFKRVKGDTLKYYIWLGAIWALVAIVLDYFLLVKLLKPADGYYKLDVYLYYLLAFAMPVAVGWYKKRQQRTRLGL
jgi:hypothetical protein